MRHLVPVFLALATALSTPARAQQNAFDLVGPAIALSVTRGETTLPIGRVPNLQAGDRLTGRADLAVDKSARYLLVIGFLRGAATPPPKSWFVAAKTWKRDKKALTITVPDGAEQAIALLVPEAGGGFDAVVDTIRERPGAFVRASQDLYQASLDRARLEAFVAGVGRIEERDPDRLAAASPLLAGALALRLNAECLTRQRSLRAACLTQNRENLVLQASNNGTSVGDRLIGAPTDVAYRIAATREGGGGFYSPYIGLARDLVRLFGAFRSTPYQYLPALAVGRDEALQLRLNTPPSFATPRSALVIALPPVGAASRPAWQVGGRGGLCLDRPGFVLPVENAPLLYATGFARDLSLHVEGADGRSVELPLTAEAERGGLLLAGDRGGAGVDRIARASLHGRWGFDRFDAVPVAVQSATAGWTPQPDAAVVVGRDHPLVLRGGAAACVDAVTLRTAGGAAAKVDWKATGPDEITATLPLTRVSPGPVTLTIGRAGGAPVAVELIARTEPSRLDGFTIHAGDREGTLTGARLDQVAELRLGEARFSPGALERGEKGDRLTLSRGDATAGGSPETPGEAIVRLRDGRTGKVKAVIAPARPALALLSRRVEGPPPAGGFAIALPDGTMPPDAMLTFSFRVTTGPLRAGDAIEIAPQDGGARTRLSIDAGGLQRVDDAVAIASIRPTDALGAAVAGPLRFRLVRGSVAGDWQPLVQLVRQPVLDGLVCPATGDACTLSGQRLFLIATIADAPDAAQPVIVPSGFVGNRIALPRPRDATLYLRLRDAPAAVVRVETIDRSAPLTHHRSP